MKSRSVWIAAFLFVAVATAAAQQGQPDTDIPAAVESLIKPEADAGLLSGAILIARGDTILVQRNFGFANWELKHAVTRTSRFPIASVTKIMTAAVADMLATEGRLDLEAPVSRYIPGFPSGAKGGAPTVRQLRDHQSGTPHRVTTVLDETQRLLPADVVELVKKKGLLFEPGSQTLYSSAGYTVLGRIIEIVERKPFAQILQERVFRPAHMETAIDETSQQLMTDRVMPYQFSVGDRKLVVANAPYKDMSFLTGAGSVYATAEDLLHFGQAARSGVLGKALQTATKGTRDSKWVGWYGRSNTEASVDLMPSTGITFVFLANLRSAATWQLRAQIRNLLTGAPTTPIKRPPPVVERFESIAPFVGLYGDPSDPVTIAEVDGHMLRDENEFYPIAGQRYCIPASGSEMWFRRGADGRVDAVVSVIDGGTERVLPRIR